MSVHTRVLSRGNILREGIGGAGNDWNGLGVGTAAGANRRRSLAAIHLRHTHVHQDGVKGVLRVQGEDIHRLHTIPSAGELDALHA